MEARTYHLHSKESIYRQSPSTKVDAAWDRIATPGVLVITPEEVRNLGKEPNSVAKAPESWGHGSNGHLAHLDGVHLLHCLNSMRKSLYYNFHHYHPDGITKAYFVHLSHCQEALAQHLMCKPSVELITYTWVKDRVPTFPDFDITRKCWNFELLLDWQERNRVKDEHTEKWREELQPGPDVVRLPFPILAQEVLNLTMKDWNYTEVNSSRHFLSE